MTCALTIAVVIATAVELQGQQVSTLPATPSPSSMSVRAASLQHGLPDQKATLACSLGLPDAFRPASTNTKDATVSEPLFSYTPLSPPCKFHLFLRQAYSPYTFASAGFQATWAHAMAQWPHYGGGVQGWGKRFGATLADTESRRFIQGFALSTVLHQDPRYFPSPKQTLLARTWYAVTRVVITKNDNGNNVVNTSEFLGTLFTSSLQNSYYPRHDRTFHDTMNRFIGALSSDATSDLLREFTPDIERFVQKHTPKRVQNIEKKLSIPDQGTP
jgi:hypothetical protein